MKKLEKLAKDKIGKVGKSENSKTDEERKDQEEEKLCKSITKGLPRRNHEKHAMLAEIEAEEQHVICIDDITGQELPWQEGSAQSSSTRIKIFTRLRSV